MLAELKKEWQLQMEQSNMKKKPHKATVQEVQESFNEDAEPVIDPPSPPPTTRSAKATVRSAAKTRLTWKNKNPNL